MALRECFHPGAPSRIAKTGRRRISFLLAPLLTILYVCIAILEHAGKQAKNGPGVLNIDFFARKVYFFRGTALAGILNLRGPT
jgi:hypothetical protein